MGTYSGFISEKDVQAHITEFKRRLAESNERTAKIEAEQKTKMEAENSKRGRKELKRNVIK